MSEPRSMNDRQASALEREWREQRAASAPPPPEPQGQRERSGLATCPESASKRRWREYPAEQFSEADLPVWGYYPGRTYTVRLIDFMGSQMTHWMPARDDIPEAPTVRQPSPNTQVIRGAQPSTASQHL